MNRALTESWHATGVMIGVATSSHLDAAAARNHTQQLIERWLDDGPGVLLTFNRGNGQSAVVASPGFWRRHPPDETAQLLADAGRLLGQVGVEPEHRIQNALSLVLDRTGQLEKKRGTSRDPFADVERKLALFVALVLGLTAAVVGSVAVARRRKAAMAGGPYLFPEAAVNTRLGAQFGGVVGESSAPRRD